VESLTESCWKMVWISRQRFGTVWIMMFASYTMVDVLLKRERFLKEKKTMKNERHFGWNGFPNDNDNRS